MKNIIPIFFSLICLKGLLSISSDRFSLEFPNGFYLGPCGIIPNQKQLDKLYQESSNQYSGEKKIIKRLNGKAIVAISPVEYLLLEDPSGAYVNELFSQKPFHSWAESYNFSRIDPIKHLPLLFVGQSLIIPPKGLNVYPSWSWHHSDYNRHEELAGDKVKISTQPVIILRGKGERYNDRSWGDITERIVPRSESWSFNHALIPKEFRKGFFCPNVADLK